MNIPEDCKHRGKFKKDCCEVLWNGVIIDHDGCVVSNESACDLVVYDESRILFIEIKESRISSKDAERIVNQIKACEDYYSTFVGHRKKRRIFLHCGSRKKKRIESYAREKLKRARIEHHDCNKTFDLNKL